MPVNHLLLAPLVKIPSEERQIQCFCGFERHSYPSIPRKRLGRVRCPVLEMQHVIESVVAEVLVHEQPLAVVDAASHKFINVGVLKLGDALNNLQEFSDRHFRGVAIKLQYCKLDGAKRREDHMKRSQLARRNKLLHIGDGVFGTYKYLASWVICYINFAKTGLPYQILIIETVGVFLQRSDSEACERKLPWSAFWIPLNILI